MIQYLHTEIVEDDPAEIDDEDVWWRSKIAKDWKTNCPSLPMKDECLVVVAGEGNALVGVAHLVKKRCNPSLGLGCSIAMKMP